MFTPQIKIVMTGPTGVGKTSLLASMYPLLAESFPTGDYELVPEEGTLTTLKDFRKKMRKLGTGGILVQDRVIQGNLDYSEFNFDLKYEDNNAFKTKELSLKIYDLPGAYCLESKEFDERSNTSVVKPPRAQEFLDGSDISFWCIDSVALMDPQDHKGRWLGDDNDFVNRPAEIANCIRTSNLNEGHTVIIVLMRAETYEQDEQDRKDKKLFERLKTEYAKHVLELRKNENIKNVYYCSVQTTGNLLHNGGDKTVGYTFVRHAGRDYEPENCDLPVLCAVQKSLETVIHRVRWQYYRTAIWMPFIRFLLCRRLRSIERRLTNKLNNVNKEISKRLDEGLFTW